MPERWLPLGHEYYDVRFENDVQEAARPFSLGPRGCLGINLAHMEMRHSLAKLIWTFNIKASSAIDALDWEKQAHFDGFWNLPSPMIQFDSRNDRLSV